MHGCRLRVIPRQRRERRGQHFMSELIYTSLENFTLHRLDKESSHDGRGNSLTESQPVSYWHPWISLNSGATGKLCRSRIWLFNLLWSWICWFQWLVPSWLRRKYLGQWDSSWRARLLDLPPCGPRNRHRDLLEPHSLPPYMPSDRINGTDIFGYWSWTKSLRLWKKESFFSNGSLWLPFFLASCFEFQLSGTVAIEVQSYRHSLCLQRSISYLIAAPSIDESDRRSINFIYRGYKVGE